MGSPEYEEGLNDQGQGEQAPAWAEPPETVPINVNSRYAQRETDDAKAQGKNIEYYVNLHVTDEDFAQQEQHWRSRGVTVNRIGEVTKNLSEAEKQKTVVQDCPKPAKPTNRSVEEIYNDTVDAAKEKANDMAEAVEGKAKKVYNTLKPKSWSSSD